MRSSWMIASVLVVACAPPPPETPMPDLPEVKTKAALALEEVATSPRRWTGVAVSFEQRIFVSYPRWSDDVPISVAELVDGKPVPFPDEAFNAYEPDGEPTRQWVAVQSVVVDPANHLWVLDTGNPQFAGVVSGAPKLVEFDLETGEEVRTIRFERPVIGPDSYLNDVRIDPASATAYLTDSGGGALIVVDLRTGSSRRLLDDHPSTEAEPITLTIGGEPWLRNGVPPRVHSDGLALDRAGGWLYYQALTGISLYRIPLEALAGEYPDEAVELVAESGPADGLLFANDRVYLTALEHDAISVFDGESIRDIIVDPRIAWPDSFALGPRGMIYFTTAQIHRAAPTEPFRLFRFRPSRPSPRPREAPTPPMTGAAAAPSLASTPPGTGDACEVRVELREEKGGPRGATVVTSVLKNLTDHPISLALNDGCPGRPTVIQGIDYDVYGTCAMGACQDGRPPHMVHIGKGGEVVLDTLTIPREGGACGRAPRGSHAITATVTFAGGPHPRVCSGDPITVRVR